MGKLDSKRREMAKLVSPWRASGMSAAPFAVADENAARTGVLRSPEASACVTCVSLSAASYVKPRSCGPSRTPLAGRAERPAPFPLWDAS